MPLLWVRGHHSDFHCSRPTSTLPIKRNNISDAMEPRKTHKLHRIYAIELLLHKYVRRAPARHSFARKICICASAVLFWICCACDGWRVCVFRFLCGNIMTHTYTRWAGERQHTLANPNYVHMYHEYSNVLSLHNKVAHGDAHTMAKNMCNNNNNNNKNLGQASSTQCL